MASPRRAWMSARTAGSAATRPAGGARGMSTSPEGMAAEVFNRFTSLPQRQPVKFRYLF